MLGKTFVTAQKRGETRALCLGFGMVACSAMMYYIVGIIIVPKYKKSFWTEESICMLMKATIKEKESLSCNEHSGDENIFQYPCLEVQVNLTVFGQVVMLYQTEENQKINPKCTYIPNHAENYSEAQNLVETEANILKKQPIFPCYYDPSRREPSALSKRLYSPKCVLFAFLWPNLMLIGGGLIVILVKTSQYCSVISAQQYSAGI